MEQRIRQFLFKELENGKDHRIDLVERIAGEFFVDLCEVEDLMGRIEVFLAEAFPEYVADHPGVQEDVAIDHFWRSIDWIFSMKNISYKEFVLRCQSDPAVEVWMRVIRSVARMVLMERKTGTKMLR